MKEEEEGGMKSALELAMEKVNRQGGKSRALTDDQKQQLQEVGKDLAARIAEVKIMSGQRMEEARAAGNVERLEELEDQAARETSRLRREAERKKEKIREEKS